MNEHTLPKNLTLPELQALLDDWRWLGALSRRIIHDVGLADDASQTVWVKSQREGASRLDRSKMVWALRRFVSSARIADVRRKCREAEAAGQPSLPSTAELIERGEQQQRVWTALCALDEPIRTSMLQHFQDGLSTQEIADRSELKPDTVRGHIRKGVILLRERLGVDSERGGLLALAAAIPGGLEPIMPAHVAGSTAVAGHLRSRGPAGASAKAVIATVGVVLSVGALVWSQVLPRATQSSSEGLVALSGTGGQALGGSPGVVESSVVRHASVERPVGHPSSRRALAPSLTNTETSAGSQAVTEHIFEGRIVLQDLAGQPLVEPLDGTLEVRVQCGEEGRDYQLPIDTGLFAISVTQDADGVWMGPQGHQITTPGADPIDASKLRVSVGGAYRDGVAIAVPSRAVEDGLEPSLSYPVLSARVEVPLVKVEPIRLIVIDAGHGDQIQQGVEVVRARDFVMLHYPPSDTVPAAAIGASPVVVRPTVEEARDTYARFFVRAPGYAWASLVVAAPNGGEHVVPLQPAGSLTVTVAGLHPPQRYVSLKRGPEDLLWAYLPVEGDVDGVLHVSGLPPGDFDCALAIGGFYDAHFQEPATRITIQAGAETELELVAETVPAPTFGSAQGHFHLSRAWQLNRPTLTIQRVSPRTYSAHGKAMFTLNSVSEVEGLPGAFAFHAPKLEVGEYHATVSGVPFPIEFTVAAGSNGHLDLRLPPPVTVQLTILDGATGQPATQGIVLWRGLLGVTAGLPMPLAQVSEEPVPGQFLARFPAGQIVVSARSSSIGGTEKLTILAREGLAVEIVVPPRARVDVLLQSDGRELQWPETFPHQLERVDGQDFLRTYGDYGCARIFAPELAGRYRIPLPVLPGFEPPAHLEVDLQLGERQELTVDYAATLR